MREMMKPIKKAFLLLLRSTTHSFKLLRLYYWSEFNLQELKGIYVMPGAYYHWLYKTCMWLIKFKGLQRIANRAIHTIPYCIRFYEA